MSCFFVSRHVKTWVYVEKEANGIRLKYEKHFRILCRCSFLSEECKKLSETRI